MTDAKSPPVILIVDDEAMLRMLAVDHFEDAGYEVIEASNGSEALECLRARPEIRGVFTDVQMPGDPDGLVLAQHVARHHPQCAVVIVSGRVIPDPDDVAPGACFLAKPYRGQRVIEVFKEMLAR